MLKAYETFKLDQLRFKIFLIKDCKNYVPVFIVKRVYNPKGVLCCAPNSMHYLTSNYLV